LKTTRGSSQSVPRPRTTAFGWARSPQNACRNPKRRYRTLVELRDWVLALLMLDNALARPAHNRSRVDLGTLAWASAFDDDLRQFRDELADALARAVSARDVTVVEDLVGDWLRTAHALSDTTAREILTREHVDDEFVEVTAPTESEHNAS
jgi:hypothetical protein